MVGEPQGFASLYSWNVYIMGNNRRSHGGGRSHACAKLQSAKRLSRRKKYAKIYLLGGVTGEGVVTHAQSYSLRKDLSRKYAQKKNTPATDLSIPFRSLAARHEMNDVMHSP